MRIAISRFRDMAEPWFNRIYARPLIPPLLALMAGEVAGLWLPRVHGLGPAIGATVICCAVFIWKRTKLLLLPLLLFFLLGHWSIQSWVTPEFAPNHVSRFVDDRRWSVVGTIKGRPQHSMGRTRFVLRTESISRKGLCRDVSGDIRVTVRGRVSGLREGDRVACLARLRPVRNFNNPGGFDYRRHLAFQDIWATASVSHESAVVKIPGAKVASLTRALASSRHAVSVLIEKATSERPPGPRGVLKALLIGDKSHLPQETRDLFSRIGTSHLLAISGLHMGIVATLAFCVFRFALGRSERLLIGAWASKGAALLSLFPVLCYGFLAGMSPATQRAVIMVAVFLLSLLFERERDSINTLALAAFVILIITPTALFSLSFQLSFTAVFAIVYVLGNVGFVIRLRSGKRSLSNRLALFLCVSAAAIMGTLPLSLYYFNQISLIGLLTNCFMVPLIGFVVVPLGLFSVLLLALTAALSLCLMKGAAFVLAFALDLSLFFSESPLAEVRTVTPTVLEIGVYYGLAWALLNIQRTPWARRWLLGLLLVLLADVGYCTRERYGCHELRMMVFDVGQGSAALLELPGGPCMLVDGGGFYDNRFDVGARVVAPFLWKKKIATVDFIILSHPHPDHLNGLLFIARHFNVKEVWMTREPVNTKTYKALLQIISENHIRVLGPNELRQPRMINGVLVEVLYPPVDFLARKAREPWRSGNNNSLVLKASFKGLSFLLPGDIEAEAEEELVRLAGQKLESDVLVAPHHGSKSSSTPLFLRYVQPDKVVISSGWKNIFRFPHERVLTRYRAMGCEIFRTDLHGAVTITTDGAGIATESFLQKNLSWGRGCP